MANYQISIVELNEDGDPIDEPQFEGLTNLAKYLFAELNMPSRQIVKIDDSSINCIDILIETKSGIFKV